MNDSKQANKTDGVGRFRVVVTGKFRRVYYVDAPNGHDDWREAKRRAVARFDSGEDGDGRTTFSDVAAVCYRVR